VGLTPHPRLVPKVLEKIRAIPLLTIRAFVAYKKGENLPTFPNTDRAHHFYVLTFDLLLVTTALFLLPFLSPIKTNRFSVPPSGT